VQVLGPVFAVLTGLVIGILFVMDNQIEVVETFTWRWNWRNSMWIAISGLIFILLGRYLFDVIMNYSFIQLPFFIIWIIAISGLQSAVQITSRISPNTGIRHSIINMLRLGTLTGLSVALINAIGFGLENGLRIGLPVGFTYGLLIGGGVPVIQHFVLRLLLYGQGKIPWNYAKFLDTCAEIGLLRKVGGGYIFIHRYLLEYFASLED
jgi:hypothetical protein